MNARITNKTTDEWLEVDVNLDLNETITIDCDAKTVELEDGTNVIGVVSFSSIRKAWLDLEPGSNELQWDLTNTGNVTLETYWRDRNA